MKGRIIFPKKTPGFAVVRSSPKVNEGVLNNRLVATPFPYGKRIGVLTGKTQNQTVEGTVYVWWETEVVHPERKYKVRGWVREDAFSLYFNNAETQKNPKEERLRLARAQAKFTQDAINQLATRIRMGEQNRPRLNKSQIVALDTAKRNFANLLAKVKGLGAVQVSNAGVSGIGYLRPKCGFGIGCGGGIGCAGGGVAGLGLAPLVIVGIVVVAGVFLAFSVDRALSWYGSMKQYELEANNIAATIDAQMKIATAAPDSAAGRAAQKELERIRAGAQANQAEIVESQKSGSFGSTLKYVATAAAVAVVGYAVASN